MGVVYRGHDVLRQGFDDGSVAGLGLPWPVVADLLTLAPDLRARYPDLPANTPLEPAAERQRIFESAPLLRAEASVAVCEKDWPAARTTHGARSSVLLERSPTGWT